MMMTYYLQFADQATYDDVLQSGAFDAVEGVDEIGPIYNPTGEVDAEGNPLYVAIPGWHVNIMADGLPSELLQYAIPDPATPYRVFA